MHRARCPGALDLVSLGTVSIRVFASLSGIPTAKDEEGGRARCYNQMKSTYYWFRDGSNWEKADFTACKNFRRALALAQVPHYIIMCMEYNCIFNARKQLFFTTCQEKQENLPYSGRHRRYRL